MTPSALPLGDPAPKDGLLPSDAAAAAAERKFGLYVHIPFCAVRCGYCDFNTYTPAELGGANPDGWLAALALTRKVLAENPTAIDGRIYSLQVRPELKELYCHKIDMLGSAGKC